MRKFYNLVFLLPLAIILIILCVANRQLVTFSFDPLSAENPAYTVEFPFFVFLFISMLIGLVLGAVITWWGQGKHRKALRKASSEAETLKQASKQMSQANNQASKEIAPGLPVASLSD